MRPDADPGQSAIENFMLLCKEIHAATGECAVIDVLQRYVREMPCVGAVEYSPGDGSNAGAGGDPDGPSYGPGVPPDWIRIPLETSSSFFGELHVQVKDTDAFTECYHLLSTVIGFAALRLENILLLTSGHGVPTPSGVAAGPPAGEAELSSVAGAEKPAHPPDREGQDGLDSTQLGVTTKVSDTLYSLIAQHSSDSIWAMDTGLKFTYLSPSTERLFGYTVTEWNTLDWSRFVHAEDISAVNKIYSDFLDGSVRVGQTSVIRVYHKNGRELWVEFTASPVFDPAGNLQAVVGVTRDITDRHQAELALEKRVLALTKPLDDPGGISFEDLFNLQEIQTLQDEFAAATGVASIITHPDGTPITKPSKFTRLCSGIIRQTEKGCANCYRSDAILGAPNADGPIVQPCLSGGLWDAGASISLGGRHIANWLIGQVRDETQTEDAILKYAGEIGADQAEVLAAFREVPSMSRAQFEQIARTLFTLANQLSTMAYQNVQQARFIAERKQAEAQLRASEQAHRSLVEAMPDVVMRFDLMGRHMFVSDNVSELVNLRAEDFLGKTHRELGFPAEQCDQWERYLRSVAETGIPLETEIEIDGIAGTMILNWRIVPEKDDRGDVQSLLSLSRDVTAQRQAERDYQTLFREMYEGFVLFRVIENEVGQPVDFRFMAINPSFERMTTVSATESVGKSISMILPPGEDSRREILRRVALTGTPDHFESEVRELGKNFEVTVFKPAPGQIACILMDVTARKQAEAERLKMERRIQHAQKLESLGVLAGGIAHDFNNILFAIMGNASMATEMLAEDHPARSMIEEISVSGDRASSLVRQILTFARRTERQRNNLDIVPLLKEVTKLMRATLPSNVVIHQELGTQRTTIFADASEVHQILMNLCTNAGYAMQAEGGSLVVRLHDQQQAKPPLAAPGQEGESLYYLIEVKDSGPGIPPEIQEKMFDPFFTTKPVGEGTGMGLALVQSITTELGGWIEVETETGQGTTLRVYLPAGSALEVAELQSPHLDLPTGTEHVMVVDDEQMIASLLNRYLRKLGYRVSMFTSSTEAAERFAAEPDTYDIAILDQTMPHLTGRDLAVRFRATRPDFPIIIATGYSSTFTSEQAGELGIRHYLDKPVVLGDLAVMVREALDQPENDAATG